MLPRLSDLAQHSLSRSQIQERPFLALHLTCILSTDIPRLVEQIINGSDAVLRGSLRGVLLGNPHIWCESLPKEDAAAHWAFVQSWFYHGLVPFTLYAKWNAAGVSDE